jgi:endonuclease/exonuclease/phosphatase family metal-dependent hydrolase
MAAQKLKVLTWNVQFMAGKDYCFFWDRSDGLGLDTRPSPEAITRTLDEVARVLLDEAADIVLLQEIEGWSKRGHYRDQEEALIERVGRLYPYRASCHYWHAPFVPHPKILGPVAMKLVTLSRHPIVMSKSMALPKIPRNWFVDLFHIKRRVLETCIQLPSGDKVTAFNTHLEAFPGNDDVVGRQVRVLLDLWEQHAGKAWIAGGDFNLIPPGAYGSMNQIQRELYNLDSEMGLVFERHSVVPSLAQATGGEAKAWTTFNSNDSRIGCPDRTLDYLVHSRRFTADRTRVRREDTLKISDHLPVVGEFIL